MTSKKKVATKKKCATAARKSTPRKPKQGREARPYVMPKTAAELGIICLSDRAGEKCGRPVIWFDYELGEREFYKGFVCDDHRVSRRVEKLAL